MCKFSPYITVAASNSLHKNDKGIDFVCTGTNDELTINKAILKGLEEEKGVYLLNGQYNIDDFYDFGDGGPKCAIYFPCKRTEIAFVGQSCGYSAKDLSVKLYVSEKALAKIGDGEHSLIRTQWFNKGILTGNVLKMENVSISLSHNQAPIRCVDLRRCDRIEMKNVKMNAYHDRKGGFGTPPDIAVKGCIGLTMTDGSNNFLTRYDNVIASGFYEGIQVGGEHVIMAECGAIMNYYGYTFGNYGSHCGSNHPITMINCLDERNVNLPLFNDCGDDALDGGRLIGGQEVTMISFNIERIARQTPGGKLGDVMKEVYPGAFCGRIDYTIQPAWHHTNEANFKLWEDGSGIGFSTTNMVHKTVCSTAERLSYYPSLGQQIFDTDLNKLLICVDTKDKKWVDALGNVVD